MCSLWFRVSHLKFLMISHVLIVILLKITMPVKLLQHPKNRTLQRGLLVTLMFLTAFFLMYLALGSAGTRTLMYLKQHTKIDGSYTYAHFPDSNSEGFEYNSIRHALTAYSLAKYLEDEVFYANIFLNNLNNSLSFLTANTIPCPKSTTDLCVVLPHEKPRLGANALSIAAYIQGGNIQRDPTLKDSYTQEAVRLETFLSSSFRKNSFANQENLPAKGKRYEDGQVLLAWSMLYEATRDDHYLQLATTLKQRIFKDLISQNDHTLHHWFWISLEKYYTVTKTTPSAKELQYLNAVTDRLLSTQIIDPVNSNYGIFINKEEETLDDGSIPLSPSSLAVHIEAAGALRTILTHASACESSTQCVRLHSAIKIGTQKLRSMQIDGFDVIKKYSLESFGGFPFIEQGGRIQIDTVAHALSALLAAKEASKY